MNMSYYLICHLADTLHNRASQFLHYAIMLLYMACKSFVWTFNILVTSVLYHRLRYPIYKMSWAVLWRSALVFCLRGVIVAEVTPNLLDRPVSILSHEDQCCLFGFCQVYTKLHPIWHNNECSTLGIESWDSTERKRGRKELVWTRQES